MAVGIIAGRYFRARGLQKPIIAVTWLLLLFLGWEVGSDRSVIEALPSIGLAAAIPQPRRHRWQLRIGLDPMAEHERKDGEGRMSEPQIGGGRR